MVPIKSVGVAEKQGSDREMLTREEKSWVPAKAISAPITGFLEEEVVATG